MSSATNGNGNHVSIKDADHPDRLLLVSCPRTASNLLLTILSLADQNVYTNEKGGYFFYDGFMANLKDNRAFRPISEWSAEEKDDVQSTFQKCFDELEQYSARAKSEGKMMFAKEHAFWFIRPEAFRDHTFGIENGENGHGTNGTNGTNGTHDNTTKSSINLQIPESYGPPQTFSSSNKTLLPDGYLRTWRFGFIIRHPALAFASLYRAMLKLEAIGVLPNREAFKYAVDANMSIRWTRILYDWCEAQRDAASSEEEKRLREPVLLDTNDVIHNPEAIARFCERTGLDATKLKFEWGNGGSQGVGKGWNNDNEGGSATQSERKEFRDKAKGIMLSTLLASSGVVKEKAPETVDIAVEVGKWKEEFGEEGAAKLEEAVLTAMPDYEYLMARRCV